MAPRVTNTSRAHCCRVRASRLAAPLVLDVGNAQPQGRDTRQPPSPAPSEQSSSDQRSSIASIRAARAARVACSDDAGGPPGARRRDPSRCPASITHRTAPVDLARRGGAGRDRNPPAATRLRRGEGLRLDVRAVVPRHEPPHGRLGGLRGEPERHRGARRRRADSAHLLVPFLG